MSIQATTADSLVPPTLSPYSKFKMALRSKEVQRQYPNLLERFLDFCKFEDPVAIAVAMTLAQATYVL